MKFILILLSMFIMISVGAVGTESTNNKTELKPTKETLSIGYVTVMDLKVDVGKSDILIYSENKEHIGKDQTVLFITKLPKTRLDKRFDPGNSQDVAKNLKDLQNCMIAVRIDKRVDPGRV